MTALDAALAQIPEPRPFSDGKTHNEWLRYARDIIHATSPANARLAREQLLAQTQTALAENHYLALAVALSLAPDSATYRLLWHTLCQALAAHQDEIEWWAFPLVMVAGCHTPTTLPTSLPPHFESLLQSQGIIHAQAQIHWLDHTVSAATLASINAGQWFAAKANLTAAEQLATMLAADPEVISGEEVVVRYALAYGRNIMTQDYESAFAQASLVLMQNWQTAYQQSHLTLFINPLAPNHPAAVQPESHTMAERMRCDLFVSRSIRHLRLNGLRPAAIIAARADGHLQLLIGAAQEAHVVMDKPMATLRFLRLLRFDEDLTAVIQEWLDLLASCHLENVRILTALLDEHETLTDLQAALKYPSFQPFFLP